MMSECNTENNLRANSSMSQFSLYTKTPAMFWMVFSIDSRCGEKWKLLRSGVVGASAARSRAENDLTRNLQPNMSRFFAKSATWESSVCHFSALVMPMNLTIPVYGYGFSYARGNCETEIAWLAGGVATTARLMAKRSSERRSLAEKSAAVRVSINCRFPNAVVALTHILLVLVDPRSGEHQSYSSRIANYF